MPTATAGGILTSPGAAIGTIAYMSPEQARGEQLDRRTDLFSLGAVFYEMTAGRMAFSGNTAAVIHDAILNRAPPPLAGVNSEISPELERIINKALEKDRKLRYQSAADIRTDLQRLNRDSATGAEAHQKLPHSLNALSSHHSWSSAALRCAVCLCGIRSFKGNEDHGNAEDSHFRLNAMVGDFRDLGAVGRSNHFLRNHSLDNGTRKHAGTSLVQTLVPVVSAS